MKIQSYDIGCEPSPSETAETLIQDGCSTFLVFLAVSKEKNEEGYLTDLGFAVVECINCSVASLGYPNDEGRAEHPLFQLGMASSRSLVLEVADSAWAKEISRQQCASVVRIWGGRGKAQISGAANPKKHFIVLLKEKTFECIAKDLKVILFAETFEEALSCVIGKLNEH